MKDHFRGRLLGLRGEGLGTRIGEALGLLFGFLCLLDLVLLVWPRGRIFLGILS